MDIRRAVGAKAGVPSEKMDDLLRYRESDRFTAREQAALVAAALVNRPAEAATCVKPACPSSPACCSATECDSWCRSIVGGPAVFVKPGTTGGCCACRPLEG